MNTFTFLKGVALMRCSDVHNDEPSLAKAARCVIFLSSCSNPRKRWRSVDQTSEFSVVIRFFPMKTTPVRILAAALFCFGIPHFAAAVDSTDSVVTAVFSRSFNHYVRPATSDGRVQPLTYVIAKGGYAPGLGGDQSADDVKFAGIVRVLGKYLARQSYYPAKNGKAADLMLVVHWGKTIPGNDGLSRDLLAQGVQGFETLQLQQKLGIGRSPGIDYRAEARQKTRNAVTDALDEAAQEEMVQGLYEIRFAQDARIEAARLNANLLGYTAELKHRDNPSLFGGAGTAYNELMEDLEAERYYVSVTAYDFQEALKNNHKKGLWRTVASIDARGNRFDEKLMTMVERASRFFGRDSERLIRQFEYTPRIDLGELKQIGLVDHVPSEQK